jgi:hypothetical protein
MVIIFYFSLGKGEAWWGLGLRIYELLQLGFVFFAFWFFCSSPLYIYLLVLGGLGDGWNFPNFYFILMVAWRFCFYF